MPEPVIRRGQSPSSMLPAGIHGFYERGGKNGSARHRQGSDEKGGGRHREAFGRSHVADRLREGTHGSRFFHGRRKNHDARHEGEEEQGIRLEKLFEHNAGYRGEFEAAPQGEKSPTQRGRQPHVNFQRRGENDERKNDEDLRQRGDGGHQIALADSRSFWPISNACSEMVRSFSSMRAFTTSPMDTTPISLPFSFTGRCLK